MILTNDYLNVTIKNITFRSSKVPGFSQQWVLDATALAGWNDGVTTRRASTQRALGDGDFADPATMSSRVVTITGVAVADTPTDLHAMRDQFIGLLADGQYTQITVENRAGVRTATVGQEATPQWTQLTDTFASFKLDMFQPDPRVYGVERLISIYGAEVTNEGALITSLTSGATASSATAVPHMLAPIGALGPNEKDLVYPIWQETMFPYTGEGQPIAPSEYVGDYSVCTYDPATEATFDPSKYATAPVTNPDTNQTYYLLMVRPPQSIAPVTVVSSVAPTATALRPNLVIPDGSVGGYNESDLVYPKWQEAYPGWDTQEVGDYALSASDPTLDPTFDTQNYACVPVQITVGDNAGDEMYLTMVTPGTDSTKNYVNYPLDFNTPINLQWQSLSNAGNVDAWPVFTVVGDFYGGFSITDNNGHTITYTGDCSTFVPVVIDSSTGRATQGGQDRTNLLTSRQWFPVPAGTSVMPTFKPVKGSTGWCDIIYKDTWI